MTNKSKFITDSNPKTVPEIKFNKKNKQMKQMKYISQSEKSL